MKLKIGQRWKFQNSNGLEYLGEITQVTYRIELEILQSTDFTGERRVGVKFEPSRMRKFEPSRMHKIANTTNDFEFPSVYDYEAQDFMCSWIYLKGQDRP